MLLARLNGLQIYKKIIVTLIFLASTTPTALALKTSSQLRRMLAVTAHRTNNANPDKIKQLKDMVYKTELQYYEANPDQTVNIDDYLKDINHTVYDENGNACEECVPCFELMGSGGAYTDDDKLLYDENGNHVMLTPGVNAYTCSHKFHKKCIDDSLKEGNFICPVCNEATVTSDYLAANTSTQSQLNALKNLLKLRSEKNETEEKALATTRIIKEIISVLKNKDAETRYQLTRKLMHFFYANEYREDEFNTVTLIPQLVKTLHIQNQAHSIAYMLNVILFDEEPLPDTPAINIVQEMIDNSPDELLSVEMTIDYADIKVPTSLISYLIKNTIDCNNATNRLGMLAVTLSTANRFWNKITKEEQQKIIVFLTDRQKINAIELDKTMLKNTMQIIEKLSESPNNSFLSLLKNWILIKDTTYTEHLTELAMETAAKLQQKDDILEFFCDNATNRLGMLAVTLSTANRFWNKTTKKEQQKIIDFLTDQQKINAIKLDKTMLKNTMQIIEKLSESPNNSFLSLLKNWILIQDTTYTEHLTELAMETAAKLQQNDDILEFFNDNPKKVEIVKGIDNYITSQPKNNQKYGDSYNAITIICDSLNSLLRSNFDVYYQNAIKIAKKYHNTNLWKTLINIGLKTTDDFKEAINAARDSDSLRNALLAHDKDGLAMQIYMPDEDVKKDLETQDLATWIKLVGHADLVIKKISTMRNISRADTAKNFYKEAIEVATSGFKQQNNDALVLWNSLINQQQGLQEAIDIIKESEQKNSDIWFNLLNTVLTYFSTHLEEKSTDTDCAQAAQFATMGIASKKHDHKETALKVLALLIANKKIDADAAKNFYKKAIEVATSGFKQQNNNALVLWNFLINQQQGLQEAIDIIKESQIKNENTLRDKLLETVLTYFSIHLNELVTGVKPTDTDCAQAAQVAQIGISSQKSEWIEKASKVLHLLIDNKKIDPVISIMNDSKYFDSKLLQRLMNYQARPIINPDQAIKIAKMCILTGAYGLDKQAINIWQKLLEKGQGINEALATVDTLINERCPNLGKHDHLVASASLLYELVKQSSKISDIGKLYEKVVSVINTGTTKNSDGSAAFEDLASYSKLLSESLIQLTQQVQNESILKNHPTIINNAIELAVVGIKSGMLRPSYALGLWEALFKKQNNNQIFLDAVKNLCEEQKSELYREVNYCKYNPQERKGVWHWVDCQEWDNFINLYKKYCPNEFKQSYPNGDPYKIQK